ncbi:MAG: c-type cytochrome [Pseudobdellovibrionaceae bacterium]
MSENQPHDSHNRAGLLAFSFSMVFVLCFLFYIVAINRGVDLGENVVDPNAPDAKAAVPVFDIATVKEPWVSDEQVVAHGAKLYATNCAMCHGAEGKGDGAAGAALNPKPRNLVEGKWTQGTGSIAHYNVLLNGIKGTSMAAYAHFSTADRWAMVQFIDSITQNKSKDDPAKIAEFAKTAK